MLATKLCRFSQITKKNRKENTEMILIFQHQKLRIFKNEHAETKNRKELGHGMCF